MKIYPRAPIIEAVINFSLKEPLDEKAVAKLSKTDNTVYTFSERDLIPNFHIDIGSKNVRVKQIDTGVKLSSMDRADICIYRKNDFVCSRLAPYLGWDFFISRAEAGWASLRRVSKASSVKRIGIRYINRVDVPKSSVERTRVEDYLNVWPHLPNFGDSNSVTGYVMQITRSAPHGCVLILNTTPIASPLPDHDSFLLDLDLYRDAQLPETDDARWELLSIMRRIKNDFFEQLITDKARALFE